MEKSKKSDFFEKRYLWIAFLAAFLPRLVFLAGIQTMSIAGDELFSMWPAAKLAGYDWGGVMDSYRYYGYGYSALLLPFLYLIHDSVLLYKCMVLVMALAQSLTAPVVCHLMKEYFDVKNKKVLCLSGVTCSYLVAVRAVYTYPEFIYVLVVWLIVWTILKLNKNIENKKRKSGYTFLLVILLTYALSVHSRASALWIALAGMIAFYAWVYRKSVVSLPVCAVLGIAGFAAFRGGLEWVVRMLGYGAGAQVSNTSAGTPLKTFEIFLNPHSWTSWFNIIAGQLNEAVINTGGFAVGIVIVLLVVFWKALWREKEIVEEGRDVYSPYIAAGIFCVLSIAVTIGGQSVTWLSSVVAAADGGDPDGFRAITYFRYYAAYAGPLLMMGIAYFFHRPEMLDRVKGKVLLIAGMLQGYWVLCILPLVVYFSGCVWSYAPFSFTRGFREDVGLRCYLPGTLAVIVMLLLGYHCCRKKKYHRLLILLCVFLVYQYGYNAWNHEGDRSRLNAQYTEGGRELLEYLRETDTEIDKVYVEKEYVPQTGQVAAYIYQFALLDIPVQAGQPDGKDGQIVYICYHPQEYEYLLDDGYQLEKLSEYEYVYVAGEKLTKKIGKWRKTS